MRFSGSFKTSAVALATAMACGWSLAQQADRSAQAGAAKQATQAAPAAAQKLQHWTASGGTVGMRWNRDLAGDLGLRFSQAAGRHAELSWFDHELFDLNRGSTLEFDVRNGNLSRFVGGTLQALGGYTITTRDGGSIDLNNFRIVPRPGDTPILDLVSADGRAWFYIDRLMYELIDDRQRLAVRTMDLRITPELAQRIGHPEVADWAIADMEFTANVTRQIDGPEQPQTTGRWHGAPVPGVPGAIHQADLFMTTFNTQYMRCDGCTGAGGNGRVVFAPSSTLRNNVNYGSAVAVVPGDPLGTSTALYTANIPWYQKFSGNFPPYNNDQHPYLIWNLYRFNADGSIEQIGRSGVKHAFLTINTQCIENPNNSQILGRGCADVYSTGNNDSANALGPRSEIIPHTNQWGRCGSIYDLNCDGIQNSSGNGPYDQRMVVRESQFSGPAHAGATYRFESWYLARQDINIFNSMASTNATFTRPSTVWVVGNQTDYRLGPTIDRWVSPDSTNPNEKSVLIATNEGHVKAAVKVIDLGGGRWQYHYAVMNLDFARPVTEGQEPNLRVIRNLGLDTLTVPVGNATITDLVFGDGDMDASNDWVPSIFDSRLTWRSATRNNALNWGTLFRFSFIANRPPVASTALMHIAADNARANLAAEGILAPAVLGAAGR